MTPATATATAREPGRLAYIALLACTTAVGAVTFVLSFVGLRDYAERVAGFDDTLSWLVPVGVDGLTLCAVAATMLLRHAEWRARAYAWSAFGMAVAASVAGNLSHAAARHLSWEGHFGAAAWPIFLALASHMVIVVRRHMEVASQRQATSATMTAAQRQPAARPATPSSDTASSNGHVATHVIAPVATPAPATRVKTAVRRATPPTGDNDLTRQRARDMYKRGERDLQVIAGVVGVSKRSVERYTVDLRQAATKTGVSDAGDSDKERVRADAELVGATG